MGTGIHLDFVLPLILGPLFLEFKLGALGWHMLIDKVNLNLIQVHYIWDVTTR
jgi:hypothetical protein